MVLFIILGTVVLITFGVLGFLFYLLSKEGQKREDEKAVPVTDLKQLKKELSSGSIEPADPKEATDEAGVVATVMPNVSLPTQDIQAPLKDDIYKKRTEELEDELRAISQKAEEQSQTAQQMIVALTNENQSLKGQQADLEETQKKITGLEGELSHLKTANVDLQTQLDSVNSKVKLLEEEKTAVQIQMEEELKKANETVSQLSREKESLSSSFQAVPDEALRQELGSFKTELDQLKQLNSQLAEKNDSMQYDLVKARAQSSALERVSSNYKIQLEDFLKKVNTAQATSDDLSKAKTRLEGEVEQLKLQNEEFAHKDQLAQFELEKNRSRLLVLERDYEELKSRVQQSQ